MGKIFLIIICLFFSTNNFSAETEILPGQEMFFNVSDFEEEIITYPEIWFLDGKEIYTQGTWVIARFMLSVRVLYPGKPSAADVSFARNIAEYALKSGYRKNASLLNNFQDSYIIGDKIAVTLLSCDKNYIPNGSMYNYSFSVNELVSKDYVEDDIFMPDWLLPATGELGKLLTIVLQSKSSSKIINMWSFVDADKAVIFEESLIKIYDYVLLVKSLNPVSYSYAGLKNKIPRYKLYFQIENSGKISVSENLFMIVEVSKTKKLEIHSIQFIIF